MFPRFRNWMLANQGTEAEAKDLFQEGLIALWHNIKKGSYQLKPGTRLSSYLLTICQRRWYEQLKSAAKRKNQALPEGFDQAEESFAWLEDAEKVRQLSAWLNKLGHRCQQILSLFYFEEKNMKEIADLLQLKSTSAKNEKYRCLLRLRQIAVPS